MVLTMVGRKKASPWTVTLLRQKTKAVDRVTGLRMPRRSLVLSSLSRTWVWPTRSDLTRAMARSFSSWVSQRAVCGRSVRVRNETRDSPMVIIPSMPSARRQQSQRFDAQASTP